MEIVEIDAYTENGCMILPQSGKKLYRIDYWEELQNHRKFGQFGSMAVYDILDVAEKLMRENHPNASVMLSMPTLVFQSE